VSLDGRPRAGPLQQRLHHPHAVSAGNERFDADLARRVIGPLYDGDGRKGTGGVPMDRVLDWPEARTATLASST